MFALISLIICSYLLLLAMLYVGWKIAMRQNTAVSGQSEKVSVVVAVRNEEKNIARLIHDLASQKHQSFEVIIVDDHSTDSTLRIASDFKAQGIHVISSNGTGKKPALTTGIALAKGSIIVTTDGDCSVSENWLTMISDAFKSSEVAMVIGPVRIKQDETFFSNLQAIEFASLIGSAAATLALKKPSMCNGANLAFRKNIFNEVRGYEGNQHIPSGDDEFLMRKILLQYPGGITFLNNPESVVTTDAQNSLAAFFQQRLRWASKWKANNDKATVFLAIFIWLVQLSTLTAMFWSVVFGEMQFAILLLIKFVAEAALLSSFCRFLNTRWNWLAFTALQFTYPWYIVATGLLASLSSFSWKGRKYPPI
jgi:biofilm PGA synthesis N-glycosyltransferase PgaC